MRELLWLALRAFIACLVLTPIFRDIFRSYGIVDQPDRRRKIHAHPIPRVGGIPIFLSYAIALYPWPHAPAALTEYLPLIQKLAPAATMIFATGLVDDLIGLKPWQKLLGQLGAAGLAYWAGVRVLIVAGVGAGVWWALPLTLIWLVACTNAFNLVDGLDGLAAGMGLVAALTLLIGSLRRGWFGCALTIIIALLCAWFSSDLFKEFFARARPELWYGLRETSYSYASGHATLSLAFYGGWAYLLARGVAPSWWRTTLIALLLIWVLAIGWSRLALGAHYPTDVLGGYLLGGVWLVLETIAIDRFLARRTAPT